MFQTFDVPSDATATGDKLAALRAAMKTAKLTAYLVPRADEHQGEYVAANSERLKWLTGFSGSAGAAVITARQAALFVDGRYTVQAELETDQDLFTYPGLAKTHLTPWVIENLKRGDAVGFDPWLVTIAEHKRLAAALNNDAIKLKPIKTNLVDKIWGRDRPVPEPKPITLHPLKYAGVAAAEKISVVQTSLKDSGEDYVILTQPDSIAWLFNIRGQDIPHTPVTLAFAIVPKTGKPELFIAPEKLKTDVKRALKTTLKVRPPDALQERLRTLKSNGKIARIDPNSAAYWFHRTLGSEKAYRTGRDPCLGLKAIKNKTEINGSRKAHERDGKAVVQFLAWLADEIENWSSLDEITVVEKLEAFRSDTGALQEISFDTITGSGPNGAIVHYRVSSASNRKLKRAELLLVDSGAQYLDGTTDITRTIAIGTPAQEMRRNYTLVLKGHIAISRARFPVGTRGIDLDPLARQALWQHGLDFDHGTGHGVGSFLSVHEGPQSISRAGMVAFEPGMILSNEPGYYKNGAYGIRIENLVLVRPAERINAEAREMLSFETLTLAPYDRALIDKKLLTEEEITWVDDYHRNVLKRLKGALPNDVRRWLEQATRPL